MDEIQIFNSFLSQFSEEKKLALFEFFSKHPELYLWLQKNLYDKAAAKETNNSRMLQQVLRTEKLKINKNIKLLGQLLDSDQLSKIRSQLL